MLNHPIDSYKNSKRVMDVNEQQTTVANIEELTDLVNVNGDDFNIRNILTGVSELILNKKNRNDLNLSSIEMVYKILKHLDIVNILSNIILQEEYNEFFDKKDMTKLESNEKERASVKKK